MAATDFLSVEERNEMQRSIGKLTRKEVKLIMTLTGLAQPDDERCYLNDYFRLAVKEQQSNVQSAALRNIRNCLNGSDWPPMSPRVNSLALLRSSEVDKDVDMMLVDELEFRPVNDEPLECHQNEVIMNLSMSVTGRTKTAEADSGGESVETDQPSDVQTQIPGSTQPSAMDSCATPPQAVTNHRSPSPVSEVDMSEDPRDSITRGSQQSTLAIVDILGSACQATPLNLTSPTLDSCCQFAPFEQLQLMNTSEHQQAYLESMRCSDDDQYYASDGCNAAIHRSSVIMMPDHCSSSTALYFEAVLPPNVGAVHRVSDQHSITACCERMGGPDAGADTMETCRGSYGCDDGDDDEFGPAAFDDSGQYSSMSAAGGRDEAFMDESKDTIYCEDFEGAELDRMELPSDDFSLACDVRSSTPNSYDEDIRNVLPSHDYSPDSGPCSSVPNSYHENVRDEFGVLTPSVNTSRFRDAFRSAIANHQDQGVADDQAVCAGTQLQLPHTADRGRPRVFSKSVHPAQKTTARMHDLKQYDHRMLGRLNETVRNLNGLHEHYMTIHFKTVTRFQTFEDQLKSQGEEIARLQQTVEAQGRELNRLRRGQEPIPEHRFRRAPSSP